jgi:hypothetical protein
MELSDDMTLNHVEIFLNIDQMAVIRHNFLDFCSLEKQSFLNFRVFLQSFTPEFADSDSYNNVLERQMGNDVAE